jgi:hypothetical protein
MRKVIITSLSVFMLIFFIAGCTRSSIGITNFNECVKAGNPVMESYPRQCIANGKTFTEELEKCGNMVIDQAIITAQKSDCAKQGMLTNNYTCNENTQTLWIDLTVNDSENCNPACVINVNTGSVEINYRCRGLII